VSGSSTPTARPRLLVSVIVPHRNTPEALDRCIQAVVRCCTELTYELLVVDNGSDAESRPRPALELRGRVLRNAWNRGFAAACNQAAAVASGRYLLFLNSDAEVGASTISRMVEELERDPGLAGVAPLQRDSRGHAESPARPWLGPLAQALALLGYTRARSPHPTSEAAIGGAPWVNAAALLIRRRVFRLVGGFDEGYFFYEEDEDLGWRFARRGYRMAVCRDATVEHHGGLTVDVAGAWPVLALYAGQARFIRRRCGVGGEWVYRASTFAAIAIKAAHGRLSGRRAPSLARAAPSRVLRLLCSRRMQVRIVGE
jgi:GT2 family glycosyltransferase